MSEETFYGVRVADQPNCGQCGMPSGRLTGHLFNGLCIGCQPARPVRRHESDGAKLGVAPTDRGSKC